MPGPIDVFNPDNQVRECGPGYYWDERVQSCVPNYSGDGSSGMWDDEQILEVARGTQDVESASLLQNQFNEFWNQYMPIAGHIQDRLSGENPSLPDEVAARARTDAGLAAQTGAGVTARGVSRYGADISGTQQQQMLRNQNNAGAAGMAGAGTLGYRDMFSSNLASMQDFISLGHGSKGAGLSGQLSANENQMNRLAAQSGMNTQANQAASAANWQVGMAGASAVSKVAMT